MFRYYITIIIIIIIIIIIMNTFSIAASSYVYQTEIGLLFEPGVSKLLWGQGVRTVLVSGTQASKSQEVV
jgi:hypothetical protein